MAFCKFGYIKLGRDNKQFKISTVRKAMKCFCPSLVPKEEAGEEFIKMCEAFEKGEDYSYEKKNVEVDK